VRFLAHGKGTLNFGIETEDTTPTDLGGTCVGTGCDNQYIAPLVLTEGWTEHVFLFEDLHQGNWGQKFPFQSSELMSLNFGAATNTDVDVWIDDIGFIKTE
jgi:hypothetical protein